MNGTRLPIRVAVHYIGCASQDGQAVWVPSRVAPFLECLAERVSEVIVVAFDSPAAEGIEDAIDYRLDVKNISFVSLGPKGTWRNAWRRRHAVGEVVDRSSVTWDVLVFYLLPNRRARLVYGRSRCPRVAAVVVATTSKLIGSKGVGRRVVNRLTAWWTDHQLRALLRRAALVVVNSEELREAIGPRYGDALLVTLSGMRSHQSRKVEDRLSNDVPNLLVAGRLTLEKGVLVALDAFAKIKAHMPAARLHVVGDGPAVPELVARAEALGVSEDLVMHGWVQPGDRLFSLYGEMDVFLFPSYADYEGFPQVLWETMAQCVLVVCTAVRGTREALEHEREVLYVPMRDADAIADAVRRLAEDPALRRRLLSAAWERASCTTMDRAVDEFVGAIVSTWPELRTS